MTCGSSFGGLGVLRGGLPRGKGQPWPVWAGLLCVLLCGAGSAAAEDSAREIMQQVHDQARVHKNQQADVRLRILDSRERVREHDFKLFYKIFPGRSRSLVRFFRPASVSGTALLSEAEDDSEHQSQWIYLPAIGSVRQLSTEERHNSFMGSDFTNADIAGRLVDQDVHEILEENGSLVRIRSIPKDEDSPYSRLESEIHRKFLVPRKVLFYDKEGQPLKTLDNQKIARVEGMYTVIRATMHNHQSDSNSTLEKYSIDVQTTISPHQVGFRDLRR